MATIRKIESKNGSVKYEIFVKHNGKQVTMRWSPPEKVNAKTIEARLKKAVVEFENDVRAGVYLGREGKKKAAVEAEAEALKIKTVEQYCEKVFMPAFTIRASENGRSSYQNMIDNYIVPSIGAIKMTDLTSAEINAMLLSYQAGGKAHSSCVKLYTVIQSICKQAFMDGTCENNPMQRVKRPVARKNEEVKTAPAAFTSTEIKQIMADINSEPLKWQVFIYLMRDTGARRAEVCGLTWADVDFKNNCFTIRRTVNYTPEKGVYIDTTKNRKTRTVFFSDETRAKLLMFKQEKADSSSGENKTISFEDAHKATQKGLPTDFIFRKKGSVDPMSPQSATRKFKKLEKQYGIEDFHPHKLRHSFASIALTEGGVDVVSVSEILGHSDTAITLRTYSHSNEAAMRQASRKMFNVFQNEQNEETEKKA